MVINIAAFISHANNIIIVGYEGRVLHFSTLCNIIIKRSMDK